MIKCFFSYAQRLFLFPQFQVQEQYFAWFSSLQVSVDDSGVPPLSATTFIKVEVHEATLHPPEVVSPRNFTLISYEDYFPGGDIGQVIAFDPDQDPLIYDLKTPQLHSMFRYES